MTIAVVVLSRTINPEYLSGIIVKYNITELYCSFDLAIEKESCKVKCWNNTLSGEQKADVVKKYVVYLLGFVSTVEVDELLIKRWLMLSAIRQEVGDYADLIASGIMDKYDKVYVISRYLKKKTICAVLGNKSLNTRFIYYHPKFIFLLKRVLRDLISSSSFLK